MCRWVGGGTQTLAATIPASAFLEFTPFNHIFYEMFERKWGDEEGNIAAPICLPLPPLLPLLPFSLSPFPLPLSLSPSIIFLFQYFSLAVFCLPPMQFKPSTATLTKLLTSLDF